MDQPAPDPPIRQIRPLPAVPLFAAFVLLFVLILSRALGQTWRERIILQAILGVAVWLVFAAISVYRLTRTIMLDQQAVVIRELGYRRRIPLTEIAEIDLRINQGRGRTYTLVLWGGDEHEPVAQIDCAYVAQPEIVRLVEQIEARDPAIGVSRQLRAWMVG